MSIGLITQVVFKWEKHWKLETYFIFLLSQYFLLNLLNLLMHNLKFNVVASNFSHSKCFPLIFRGFGSEKELPLYKWNKNVQSNSYEEKHNIERILGNGVKSFRVSLGPFWLPDEQHTPIIKIYENKIFCTTLPFFVSSQSYW